MTETKKRSDSDSENGSEKYLKFNCDSGDFVIDTFNHKNDQHTRLEIVIGFHHSVKVLTVTKIDFNFKRLKFFFILT